MQCMCVCVCARACACACVCVCSEPVPVYLRLCFSVLLPFSSSEWPTGCRQTQALCVCPAAMLCTVLNGPWGARRVKIPPLPT